MAGKYPVDGNTAAMFLAFMRTDNRFPAESRDE